MQKLYLLFFLCFTLSISTASAQSEHFSFYVETTSVNETFTIPTDVTNYTYDYNVVIFKAFTSNETIYNNVTGNLTHTFPTPGTYIIRILEGSLFPRIRFDYAINSDEQKITGISQWGNNPWATMESAFEGCSNLTLGAYDTPDLSNVTSTKKMFEGATSLTDIPGLLGSWDMSNVKNTSSMFRECTVFNEDLSNWDTSSVENMQRMFQDSPGFDQNLGNWDMSNVTITDVMFGNAGVSTSNYDATIKGWGTLDAGEARIPTNIKVRFDNSTYCTSEAIRTTLSNAPYNWTFTDSGLDCGNISEDTFFITTWQTTTANETITIPTAGPDSYAYYIDWGDGQTDNLVTGNITHSYSSPSTYTVKISGTFPKINFNDTGTSRLKIKSIEQWGDINWQDMSTAFFGCENLVYNATDAPDLSDITSFNKTFRDCTNMGSPNLNGWDVSNITTMESMFRNTNFNGNITNWDVGKVNSFYRMLCQSSFNQNISGWNIGEHVSTVSRMDDMFWSNSSFNQPIASWDVSKVKKMNGMFRSASGFNQNLASWDISSVTDMSEMLNYSGLSTANYDATLTGWATLTAGEIQIPTGINLGAIELEFCAAIPSWYVLDGTYSWTITDKGVNCGDSAFITTWETTSANETLKIPINGVGYNYYIDWGDGTEDINQTGQATHTYATAGTHTIKIVGDFPRIYFNYAGFRDKIISVDQWGTQQWDTMEGAFRGCGNLRILATDAPDLSNTTNLEGMFTGCGSIESPDLTNWNVSTITNMQDLFNGAQKFNGNITNWNTANVETFFRMFSGASFFNQDILGWNVGKVTTFSQMFYNAVLFNQNISNWNIGENTANGASLFQMFRQATAFDQSLATLNTSHVNSMTDMFLGAGISQENYDNTLKGWETLDAGETTIPQNITFNGGSSTFCKGANARRKLILNNGWSFTDGGLNCTEADKFITTWQTTTVNESITIRTSGGYFDYMIEWGDGTTESVNGNATHTYVTPGVHTVKISGSFPKLYINGNSIGNNLLSVEQWGSIQWADMVKAFKGASNMVINATDTPDLSNCGDFYETFYFCNNLTDNGGALANWDFSNITRAPRMFQNSGLSSQEYDDLLIALANNPNLPDNIEFGAQGVNYCVAVTERAMLQAKGWSISDAGINCDEIAFTTTWETTSANESITIPTTGAGYDYYVDWGDGTVESGFTGNATHSYATAGTYIVKIWGDFPRIYFNNNADADKILTVEQWGNISWTSMENAFNDCDQLKITATDAPDLSKVTSFKNIFRVCRSLSNEDLSHWDVSNITNMGFAFYVSSFNGNISAWDVGSVSNFIGMFSISQFNQDISNWNIGERVSGTVNMGSMFQQNTQFDQNLGAWDISKVSNVNNFLQSASISQENYDATLIGWATLDTGETQIPIGITLNAGSSTYCKGQTARNTLTNAPYNWSITDGGIGCDFTDAFITNWETTVANENITIPTNGSGYDYFVDWGDGTVESGFTGNASHSYATVGTYIVKISGDFPRIYFNNTGDKDKIKSIEQWGTQEWTSTIAAFYGCTNLTLNATDTPDLSQVTYMDRMFKGTTAFVDNQNKIGTWNVENIISMVELFSASAFNENINAWNVQNVQTMGSMFQDNTTFNKPLNNWAPQNVSDFEHMFNGATVFNQDLSSWTLDSATYFESMFQNATAFNQDLSAWDISQIDRYGMVNMLVDAGMSKDNYDATLIGWASLDTGETQIPVNVKLDADANYCLGETARNTLINTYNWSITDSGSDCKVNWTGNTNSFWLTGSNWSNSVAPIITDNVIIPNVVTTPSITTSVEINNLTVEALSSFDISEDGSLTTDGDFTNSGTFKITSTALNSGSLLVKGTSNGTVTYERGGLLANKWSIVSAPVDGQSIKEFVENVNNNIRVNTTTSPNRYAVSYYDDSKPSGSKWIYYDVAYLAANPNITFEKGRSYAISRGTDGAVSFTGTVTINNISKTVVASEWNAIGNPYTAFLPINENGGTNFINENSSKLDPANVGVYVWDNQQDKYVGKSLITSEASLAPGQGFFIKTTTGISDVIFNESQRKNQPITGGVFARGITVNKPSIQLSATSKNTTITTAIKYFENATIGLDPGYDLGNFARQDFDIYTKLVDTENKGDFTIQSLPINNIETTIIPLGLKISEGEEVTFTATLKDLSAGVSVFIEDKKLQTFTKLNASTNDVYTVNITEKVNETGRFYLHAKQSIIPNEIKHIDEVKVYTNDSKNLIIDGISKGDFTIKLYTINGRLLLNKTIEAKGKNTVPLLDIETGIYIVNLGSELGSKTQKIILKK
ncbi:BspA family leucine-rich repeat surface protein [Tenacibaculum insulae]|uniref:BspA family leucine-rich repeat surface protein n=1 Tax=Tenacibaculum insulae TaxID=2029677 RepID=UPI003AB85AEE